MSGQLTSTVTILVAPISVAQMRGAFPAFADSSVYTDEFIDFWLTLGTTLLDPNLWQSLLNIGLSLFVAHNLSLEYRSQLVAQRGGVPGEQVGAVSGKSINGVSASYDTGSTAVSDGGDWNQTTYGKRFIMYARMVGTSPAQIIGPDAMMAAGSLFTSFGGMYPTSFGGNTFPVVF